MALKSISQRGKKPTKETLPQAKNDSPKACPEDNRRDGIQETISRIKADLAHLEKQLEVVS